MKYEIKNVEEINSLALEGKKIKVITKQGKEILDSVFYQGNLDWDKLNNNLGVFSIGYDYLFFENNESKIKYEDILSIEIL